MSSINGFGTTFYGECDYEADGTYVMTYWFILAYLPIIPLYSVRLYSANTPNFSLTTRYEFIKLPIHWRQVFRTWAYIGGWILGIFFFAMLVDTVGKAYYQAMPFLLILLIVFGLGMMILPNYLRRQDKRRAGFSEEQLKWFNAETKRTLFILALLLIPFGLFMWFTSR